MMGLIARYRHARGYGIHSPFAYRFITETLNERMPYYDYERIADPRQRLLYRIAVRLRPAAVAVMGDADADAVLMACPHARAAGVGDADMILVDGHCDDSVLRDSVDRHCVVVLTGAYRDTLRAVRRHLVRAGCGMTFDNHRDMAVVVASPKLPRQDFEVGF